MEFSQRRDGSYSVYARGQWIGAAVPLVTGQWAFVSRWNDVLCVGLTLEGLAELIKMEDEDDNGVYVAKGS